MVYRGVPYYTLVSVCRCSCVGVHVSGVKLLFELFVCRGTTLNLSILYFTSYNICIYLVYVYHTLVIPLALRCVKDYSTRSPVVLTKSITRFLF